MLFGQLVFGPPGSGKTTYCSEASAFLEKTERAVIVVNLDPANEALPYLSGVDIHSLVNLEQVMVEEHLGPNGGFIFCMEYLEKNLDWLDSEIEKHSDRYFLFDCPGQVELFTIHPSFQRIVSHLVNQLGFHLCAVNLIDSVCCCQPFNFLSSLLVSLTSMLQLELPHVNVLSKFDLLPSYGTLEFNTDFYSEVQDLSHLLTRLRHCKGDRFPKLSEAIAEVIEEYSLVSFHPLDNTNPDSVGTLLKIIDRANGFSLQGVGEEGGAGIWGVTAKIIYDEYENPVS